MCLHTLYHYTDRKGMEGILNSRKILRSSRGLYGPGVYLTNLEPERGRKEVADNCWDGRAHAVELEGKVNYAISVRLPDTKLKRHEPIFVFNEDVDVDMTTYKLFSKDGSHRQLELCHSDDEDSGEEAKPKVSADNSDDGICTIL